jgi:polyisoprenoid-binding protein YceI
MLNSPAEIGRRFLFVLWLAATIASGVVLAAGLASFANGQGSWLVPVASILGLMGCHLFFQFGVRHLHFQRLDQSFSDFANAKFDSDDADLAHKLDLLRSMRARLDQTRHDQLRGTATVWQVQEQREQIEALVKSDARLRKYQD